jgi:DNA ligase-associated metallophosphoesterase
MTPAPVHLAGEKLLLDPQGALYWPAQHLLAVADLHLEKGSAAAARGSLLPPWDTRTTLDRLAALVRRYAPRVLLALGDSFHDRDAWSRLHPHDASRLAAIVRSVERCIWVLGNHDPHPPQGIGGEATTAWVAGGLVFRHEAARGGPPGEISGHFHPKAHVPARGATVTRACFVCDGRRIMLPALGAYTGGLDVRSPAIARLFPRGGRVFLLGKDRLYSFVMSAGAPITAV